MTSNSNSTQLDNEDQPASESDFAKVFRSWAQGESIESGHWRVFDDGLLVKAFRGTTGTGCRPWYFGTKYGYRSISGDLIMIDRTNMKHGYALTPDEYFKLRSVSDRVVKARR